MNATTIFQALAEDTYFTLLHMKPHLYFAAKCLLEKLFPAKGKGNVDLYSAS